MAVSVARIVRRWVGEKEEADQGLLRSWFFSGGTWRNRSKPKSFVRVVVEAGKRSTTDPEFWGLHYQQVDSDPKTRRFWYTDIGLHAVVDNELVFTMRVSHALQHDFIGIAPPVPTASSPRLIRYLFDSHRWTVHSGGTVLTRNPVAITLGKGESLANSIFDPKRTLPIVYVNGDYDSGEFPIKADVLQLLLLGNAVVCWSGYSQELAEELEYFLPGDYRCGYRMIRVFMPEANKEKAWDFKRHRFFTKTDIHELSAASVVDAVVAALARRARIRDTQTVASIGDIEDRVRELRLQNLRAEGASSPELIKLQEEEIGRLIAENKAANQLLEETDAINHRLEFDVESLKANLQNLKASKAGSESVTPEDRESLAKVLSLPKSAAKPLHCIRALAIIYPDRIRLLSSAVSSAEDSASFQFVQQLWELLWKLAADYHPLLANGGTGDTVARNVFGKNSYSAKESESVESSPRLLKYRKFVDGDKTRTMLRHLKIGVKDSKAETIRVHFDWDSDEKKIVIGHCGPHLPLS
jgi:hypothetical protein